MMRQKRNDTNTFKRSREMRQRVQSTTGRNQVEKGSKEKNILRGDMLERQESPRTMCIDVHAQDAVLRRSGKQV